MITRQIIFLIPFPGHHCFGPKLGSCSILNETERVMVLIFFCLNFLQLVIMAQNGWDFHGRAGALDTCCSRKGFLSSQLPLHENLFDIKYWCLDLILWVSNLICLGWGLARDGLLELSRLSNIQPGWETLLEEIDLNSEQIICSLEKCFGCFSHNFFMGISWEWATHESRVFFSSSPFLSWHSHPKDGTLKKNKHFPMQS